MKVTSNKTIHFPKLDWGIRAGEERDLPSAKKDQELILANPHIAEVGGRSTSTAKGKSESGAKSDKK